MLKTYKIQDICVLEKGKQIDTSLLDDNNPYQYINGGISASGYYDKYNTKENTIIVSEGGASCGYVNFMTEKFWCGCHCYRLMEPKVKSEYLYYALKANQQGIMRLRSGCTMPNIKKSSFYNMQIKLDNNQDNQIKVTSILKKVTTLILKRKEQLTKLDFLAKSRFIEMFGDVKNQKYVFLSRYAEFSSGYSFKTECFQKGGVPIIRISNINGDKVTVDNVVYYSNSFWDKNPSFRVNKYDILIAMSGATTGKTGMFLSDTHALLNQRVAIIKPTLNCSTKEFLLVFTKMESFLEQIKLYSAGCAQPNISIKQLKNIKIPYATIEQQHNFSLFIQQLDKSKFRIKKSLEKLEMTYKALLQEYFG